jgi:hypothetical protein
MIADQAAIIAGLDFLSSAIEADASKPLRRQVLF